MNSIIGTRSWVSRIQTTLHGCFLPNPDALGAINQLINSVTSDQKPRGNKKSCADFQFLQKMADLNCKDSILPQPITIHIIFPNPTYMTNVVIQSPKYLYFIQGAKGTF